VIPWLTLRGMRADVPARLGMDPHSSANPPQTMAAAAHRGRCLRGHGHCRPGDGSAHRRWHSGPVRRGTGPRCYTPGVPGLAANAGGTEQAFYRTWRWQVMICQR